MAAPLTSKALMDGATSSRRGATPDDRVTFKAIENKTTDPSMRLSLNQFMNNPFQRGCRERGARRPQLPRNAAPGDHNSPRLSANLRNLSRLTPSNRLMPLSRLAARRKASPELRSGLIEASAMLIFCNTPDESQRGPIVGNVTR
jgi:hypothetical protein